MFISQNLFDTKNSYLIPDTTQYGAFNEPIANDLDHRSNVQKMAKIYEMGHISGAISPTDFIFSTKVHPYKAHSMTLVPINLTQGQGQISPKMMKI